MKNGFNVNIQARYPISTPPMNKEEIKLEVKIRVRLDKDETPSHDVSRAV